MRVDARLEGRQTRLEGELLRLFLLEAARVERGGGRLEIGPERLEDAHADPEGHAEETRHAQVVTERVQNGCCGVRPMAVMIALATKVPPAAMASKAATINAQRRAERRGAMRCATIGAIAPPNAPSVTE